MSDYRYKLCLVTDEKAMQGRPFLKVVEEALKGGVTMVQLREKTLDTRLFLKRAAALKEMLSPYDVPLMINDRMDIAMVVDAAGIHVGQQDMPVESVRQFLSTDKLVGLSIENVSQGLIANDLPVDYYGLGPIYHTPTKDDIAPPIGLEGIERLKKQTHHVLMAIGGIHEENVREVIRAGADGVAVVSAICSAQDPKAAASALRDAIDEELDQRT